MIEDSSIVTKRTKNLPEVGFRFQDFQRLGTDAVMEALPRFNPATATFTTFVYGLARRRMWLVARAGFYGLSPEQMHRLDTAQRTPRYHGTDGCLRSTPAPTADTDERLSVGRV